MRKRPVKKHADKADKALKGDTVALMRTKEQLYQFNV
jgi:hypothetical protein